MIYSFYFNKLYPVHFWQGRYTFRNQNCTGRYNFGCENCTGGTIFARYNFCVNYIHARSLHIIGRNLCEVVQFSFQLYVNAMELRRIQGLVALGVGRSSPIGILANAFASKTPPIVRKNRTKYRSRLGSHRSSQNVVVCTITISNFGCSYSTVRINDTIPESTQRHVHQSIIC